MHTCRVSTGPSTRVFVNALAAVSTFFSSGYDPHPHPHVLNPVVFLYKSLGSSYSKRFSVSEKQQEQEEKARTRRTSKREKLFFKWILEMKSELELPPGFRFHPTDEELVNHYLCKKCASMPLSVPIIREIDLYKYDPWQLPGKLNFFFQILLSIYLFLLPINFFLDS